MRSWRSGCPFTGAEPCYHDPLGFLRRLPSTKYSSVFNALTISLCICKACMAKEASIHDTSELDALVDGRTSLCAALMSAARLPPEAQGTCMTYVPPSHHIACRARGCELEVIAYGHHPLAVVAHPDTRPWTHSAPRRIPGAPISGGGFRQGARQVSAFCWC